MLRFFCANFLERSFEPKVEYNFSNPIQQMTSRLDTHLVYNNVHGGTKKISSFMKCNDVKTVQQN